ncbi:MAG TPA: hypothetical protein VER03_14465 [Bryobacteraceae bacterium]|nr:hypothetical protein [Bryobacteraceae bacterium]
MLSWLGNGIAKVDEYVRFRDLALRRTCGGVLSRFGIQRHTLGVVVYPAFLCALAIAGSATTGFRAYAAILTFLVAAAALLAVTTYSEKRNWPLSADLVLQLVILAIPCAVVWLAGSDRFQSNGLYRHLYIPVIALFGAALLFASMLAWAIFRALRSGENNLRTCLTRTELFASSGGVRQVTLWGALRAFVTVPIRAPLHLLLPAALCALVAPPDYLTFVAVSALLISFLALFLSGLNDRFNTMWKLLQSGFFRGGALFVSVLAIALAAARLAGVSYVKTVLDTAAGQTIALTVAAAYVLSWWYDYWVNRLLAQQLLNVIHPDAGNQPSIPYAIDPECVKTSVPAEGRVVQIHGPSHFIALRAPQQGGSNPVTYFQSYDMSALVRAIALSGAPGGKAKPSPDLVYDRVVDYHRLVAAFLALLVIAAGLSIHGGVQSPQIVAGAPGGGRVQLPRLLFDEHRIASGRPIIVMAASGGGTRAALYTAAVMEALARRGAAGDILLGSGVSGGGAALAYFAGRRTDLLQQDASKRQAAWDSFFSHMSAPFIQDVLERSSEWRMVTHGRLGMLLSESFEDRWELPPDRRTLGAVNDFGLILNTSIAGHFDKPDVPADQQNQSFLDAERRYRKRATTSELAGARLIVTNLNLARGFIGDPLETNTRHKLPIVVDDGSIRLERAAALNANFPPVFANAAVDVDNRSRFWVTDGGAVDNRGMEMLLYAIRQAIEAAPEGRALPRMHVVVADASGYSDSFSQDRGVGPAFAAGTRFASLLARELVESIKARYTLRGQREDFAFWYLTMPDEIRASTSFGTHWMLQPRVIVQRQKGSTEQRTLSGAAAIDIIRSLYAPGARQLDADAKTVLQWLRQRPSQWTELEKSLGKTQ